MIFSIRYDAVTWVMSFMCSGFWNFVFRKKNSFRSFTEFAIKKCICILSNACLEAAVSPQPHFGIGINLKHRLLMTSISSCVLPQIHARCLKWFAHIWANISFCSNEFRCGERSRKQALEYFQEKWINASNYKLDSQRYSMCTCEVTECCECWIEKSTRIVIMWWEMKFKQLSIGTLGQHHQ